MLRKQVLPARADVRESGCLLRRRHRALWRLLLSGRKRLRRRERHLLSAGQGLRKPMLQRSRAVHRRPVLCAVRGSVLRPRTDLRQRYLLQRKLDLWAKVLRPGAELLQSCHGRLRQPRRAMLRAGKMPGRKKLLLRSGMLP